MKNILNFKIITCFFILANSIVINTSYSQNNEKDDFLESNRFDIENSFDYNFNNEVKMVGFGAYHGSIKTEDIEINLFNHLANKGLKFYFPEMDFSMAHYFQQYCDSPNDSLLKDLIIHYGFRVPQERSVEFFYKWKELAPLISKNNIKIIGVDPIHSYKYSIKHLLNLIEQDWLYKDSLEQLLTLPYYRFQVFDKEVNIVVKNAFHFLKENYVIVSDRDAFDHIVNNLDKRLSEKRQKRDVLMCDNYIKLNEKFKFGDALQFTRMGVGHLYKSGTAFLHFC